MEYPTLITAGTAYGLPEGLRLVELVIIHEFGHNFWYHLLASNEFEESWMDEGINTYTEIQIVNDKYGPVGDMINFLGLKLNGLQLHRGSYIFAADYDPTVRRVWEYYSNGSYGTNSYARPGVLLTTLQNYLGKETMQKIMRAYVERWRFKHPKTRDFIEVANDVSGQNLNWFFDQALFSNATLDYSVDRVSTREIKKGEGFDFDFLAADSSESNGRAGAKKDEPDDSVKSKGQPKFYESGVHIRRLGAFKFPVDVVAEFANGEKVREQWDGQELWKKFIYIKPTKLVSASIDLEQKIALDMNFTNNSKAVEASSLGVNKLAARLLFWMQFLLDQPEFISLLSGLMPSF